MKGINSTLDVTAEVYQEEVNYLEDINNNIKEYSNNFSTYDLGKIQDIRDKLSLNLHYLSDMCANLKFEVESAEFNKKLEIAKACELLRGNKDDKTGKVLTREQITDKAVILTSNYSIDVTFKSREFNKIKLLFETVSQILNSISTRINLRK